MAKTHDETGRRRPPIDLELAPGTKETGPLIWVHLPSDEALRGQVIDFHELVVDWIANYPADMKAYEQGTEQMATAFEAAAGALREALRRRRGH